MPKLSDIQLVILSNAAQRDGGAVLPPPKRLKVKGSALTRLLKSLLRKDLVEETPAPPDAPAWREGDDGQRIMLTISPAGFEAIGIEPDAVPTPTGTAPKPKCRRKAARPKSRNPKKPASSPTARRRSKQDTIIAMLRRRNGVTIQDLQTATGWQPHSVRAALTGLRKKGFEIVQSKPGDKVTRYRITGGPKDAQP